MPHVAKQARELPKDDETEVRGGFVSKSGNFEVRSPTPSPAAKLVGFCGLSTPGCPPVAKRVRLGWELTERGSKWFSTCAPVAKQVRLRLGDDRTWIRTQSHIRLKAPIHGAQGISQCNLKVKIAAKAASGGVEMDEKIGPTLVPALSQDLEDDGAVDCAIGA
ncbi:hypothetical protein BKA80DRAFT_253511 [Phyllosticta citrichinensis]